jgi:hypothetical protein
MFPKIPGENDLLKTVDDLNDDSPRGESYQIQVMESIHVLTTFHEIGHNVRKLLAKERGQFTFHMIRL